MFQSVSAVVGTGFIGPIHVEGLLRAGVRVKGILGTSLEKSKAAAEKLGLAVAYESWESLLRDPEVNVIHLTSPNRYHYEQTLAAFRAKKHVLCEKPLAMDSRESSHLVRAAAESGLVAGVNYNVRYYPLAIEASQRIRSGELGRIFHVSGSYVQDWLHHPTDFNWRVLASEGGALRALADIGTHWLDLIAFITNLEVEEVFADLQTVYPVRKRPTGGTETFSGKQGTGQATQDISIDTEDYGSVMLRMRGGAKGVMHVSQVTAGRKNCIRYEIAGEKGTYAWNSQAPNSLWIGHRDHANQELIRDPSLLGSLARQHTDFPGGHNEGFPDTMKQLFRDFYGYLEGDRSQSPRFPSFQDGHREIILCESILESAKTGGWVKIT